MTADAAPSSKRRIVFAFAVFNFVFTCGNWMLFVFLPIYLRNELGFSPGRVGILVGCYIVTTLLLILPLGYLSDRVSPKRLVLLGTASFLFYAAALTLARSFWALVPTQILGGIGEATILIVLPALLYKDLGAAGRGRNVGAFVAGAMFGFSIGPLMAAALLDRLGLPYRAMFALVGTLAAALIGLSMLLKDAPPLRIHITDYLGDIRRREVLLIVIAIAGIGVHFGQERTTYPVFLNNVLHLTRWEVACVFGVIGIWMGSLTLVAGRAFDRNTHVVGLIGVGLAISGGMHIAAPFAKSFAGILALRMLHTIGDVLVVFCFNVLVASIFPRARLGGNAGFTLMFRAIGGVVGAAIAGQLDALDVTLKLSFAFAGGVMVLCGAVLLLNGRTFRRISRGIRTELAA